MVHRCVYCEALIHSPDDTKWCLEDHDYPHAKAPDRLHVSCPCPKHGWDAEFRFLAED